MPANTNFTTFRGFWRFRDYGEVYAVHDGNYKVWVPTPARLAKAQALVALAGLDTSVKVQDDLEMFAAFGQIAGVVPPGCDPWGVHT
jgi:hypothetical protein